MTTFKTPDWLKSIREAHEAYRRIQAKNDMEAAAFNFHAFADTCPRCGYRYRVEGRRLFLCQHMWDGLIRHPSVSKRRTSDAMLRRDLVSGYEVVIE